MVLDLLADQTDQSMLLTASLLVTDETGDVVLEFPFSEALIGGPGGSQTRH